MNIVVTTPVQKFAEKLDARTYAALFKTIRLLEAEGNYLSMPYAKPVGDSLWELRVQGSAEVRVLYGFCKGSAVLVLGFKKQQSALRQRDITLAKNRLKTACA